MNTDKPWPEFDWHDKKVIVTGFLGRHVVAGLHARGLDDDQIVVPRSAEYDLRRWDAIQQLFHDAGLASSTSNPRVHPPLSSTWPATWAASATTASTPPSSSTTTS